jgi:DNA-binding response OmpR family regulator
LSHTVLLVDSDAKSLRVVEVSLRKAGYQVVVATTGPQALDLAHSNIVDIVVTASRLPQLDGFELASRVHAVFEHARIPFILLIDEENARADKLRGLELGVEEFITKPVFVKELLARVQVLLEKRDRLRMGASGRPTSPHSGSLADTAVVDLIQTVAASNKSGVISLRRVRGDEGQVYFRAGRIIDAEVGPRFGADGIYRLLLWPEGHFEVQFKSVRRKDVIDRPIAELLTEGMRRVDEWDRVLTQLPPLNAVLDIDVRVLCERLSAIPDELNVLLRHFDGRRTLGEVIDAADCSDLAAVCGVLRLYLEKLIAPPPGSDPVTSVGAAGLDSSRETREPTVTNPGLGAFVPESDPVTVSVMPAMIAAERDEEPAAEPPPPPPAARLEPVAGTLGDVPANDVSQPLIAEVGPATAATELAVAPPAAHGWATTSATEEATLVPLGEATAATVTGAVSAQPPEPVTAAEASSPADLAAQAVPTEVPVPPLSAPATPPPVFESPRSFADEKSVVSSGVIVTPLTSVSTPAQLETSRRDLVIELSSSKLEVHPLPEFTQPSLSADSPETQGPAFESSPAAVFSVLPLADAGPKPEHETTFESHPVLILQRHVRRATEAAMGMANPDVDAPSGPVADPSNPPPLDALKTKQLTNDELEAMRAKRTVGAEITDKGNTSQLPARQVARLRSTANRVTESDPQLPRVHGRKTIVAGLLATVVAVGIVAVWPASHESPSAPVTTVPVVAPPPVTTAPPVVTTAPSVVTTPSVVTPPTPVEPRVAVESPPVKPATSPVKLAPAPEPRARKTPSSEAAKDDNAAPPKPAVAEKPAPEKPVPVADEKAGAAVQERPGAEVVSEAYDGLLKQAWRFYKRGQTERAVALTNKALAVNPGGDGAMVLFGNLQLDRGNLKQAGVWADRALGANGYNSDAHLLKGAILQQSGQTREAKKFYQRYLELAPQGEFAQDVRAIVESL